jgi:hypothetical protein
VYIEKAVTMPVVLAEFITTLLGYDDSATQRIRAIKSLHHMSFCLDLKEAKLIVDRLATASFTVSDDMAIIIMPKGS